MELVVDANILLASFLKEAVTRELLLDSRLNKEDAPYLAVGLLLNIPIRSNDRGLKNQNIVKVHTTADIIKILEKDFPS